MRKKLIIDVGMHKGEDTEFYLKRGFRVVGVEANPILVSDLKTKFAPSISSGDLIIIDKAVAEEPGIVDFYINDQMSVWGSIDPTFVERNARNGKAASQIVQVASTTMEQIVSDFPDPYYLKIDVEGVDLTCLESLSRSVCRPKFVSIESSVSSPINRWSDELMLFRKMGYEGFKFVNQARLNDMNELTLDREGSPIVYAHAVDSSGPFGEETPGEWTGAERAAEIAKQLRSEFEAYSKASNTPRQIVKIRRLLRRLRGLPIPAGWYDLHARLPA